MEILSLFLLAISLSIDAFGVGISYGLRNIVTPWRARFIICFISVLVTSAAVGLGNVILLVVPANMAKIIGVVMLIALGLFIIFQVFLGKSKKTETLDEELIHKKDRTLKEFVIKSIGISIRIIKNPVSFDLDKSKHIDCTEAIYLGVVLSVDSFGVGLGSAVSGFNSMMIPLAVGAFQILFLGLGDYIGKRLRLFKTVNSNIFVIISGVLLIGLAFLRLM